MAQLILGVNNGFAAKSWPEPMVWARFIGQDLGLKEVQLSFDLLDPLVAEPERSALCDEVLRAVKTHGLSLHTTFTGGLAYGQNLLAHPSPAGRAHARRWYEAALAVTARLGAEATGGHIGALSTTDYASPGRREYLQKAEIDLVRRLTHTAAALGQQYFVLEVMPWPREIPHTLEESLEVLRAANEGAGVPVRLCVDLGHCCAPDLPRPGDPYEWLETLLPWTPVVHLQQTDGKADRHWPFSPAHAKDGIIDPQRVIEIVKDSPLERVYLVFELLRGATDQQTINEHKWSVEAWTRWL